MVKVRKSIIIFGLISIGLTICLLESLDKNESNNKLIGILENTTTIDNYSTALTVFYNSLNKSNNEDDRNKNLLETTMFNCNSGGCTSLDNFKNIGFLTKYEYDLIGGDNSYLYNYSDYYVINNEGNIESLSGDSNSGIRPTVYLNEGTKVTGSGTVNDPYKISHYKDINFIAYTFNGKETDIKYSELIKTKAIKAINCENGTKASWDTEENVIKFKDTKVPDFCTIDFTDGIQITLNATNGTVMAPVTRVVANKGETTYTVTPNSGYKLTGSSISCDGGATIELTSTGVKISNITKTQTCKISLVKSGPFKEGTFAERILIDNPNVQTRTDFSKPFTADSFNTTTDSFTIYKVSSTSDKQMTEDTNNDGIGEDVYYYAGYVINNWVKFGTYPTGLYYYSYVLNSQLYTGYVTSNSSCCPSGVTCTCNKIYDKGDVILWRIIRTNEDGGVRLLYTGFKNGIIDNGATIDLNYTYTISGNKYYTLGYMYDEGTNYNTATVATARNNKYSSYQKTRIDTWYQNNLLNDYDKYISKTAIYCDDRSVNPSARDSNDSGIYGRVTNYTPSYKCGSNGTGGLFESSQAKEDKFSVSLSSGGNGKLSYPIAMMTADEVSFAGGTFNVSQVSPYFWMTQNKYNNGGMETAQLMGTTSFVRTTYNIKRFILGGTGGIGYNGSTSTAGLRPVISLKSCVKWLKGDGTANHPYEVTIDDACANTEN